jgi:hypothetical protein
LKPTAASRRPDAALAAILALALLLGGMPLTLGIVVHSSEEMFTLDICHPLQSFSHSPMVVAAIIPDSSGIARFLPECGRYAEPSATLRLRAADAPDPPPPETRV